MSLNFGSINRAVAFNPTTAFPLDKRQYFEDLASAQEAAKSAREAGDKTTIYYYGMTIAVVINGKPTYYIINKKDSSEEGELKEVGKEYDDSALKELLNNKVDKEEGKGLSTNDFTTEEKEKLAGLNNYDDTEIRNSVNTNTNDITELKKHSLSVKTLITASEQEAVEKIDTQNDIRIYDLIESGEDGVVIGTTANSFSLAINSDTEVVNSFVNRTVNCVVNNKTTRDINITLPTSITTGWTVINGMSFTTLSAGKSGEFNFLFIVKSKTVRILGEVLV